MKKLLPKGAVLSRVGNDDPILTLSNGKRYKLKSPTSIKVIKLELFPYDVMVAHQVSVEEIKKTLATFGVELDKEGEDCLKSSGLAHTVKLPNRAVLMYFPGKTTPGLIAHEVFHAVWMILGTMGVTPSEDSNEVYAYMIEYLANQISPLTK